MRRQTKKEEAENKNIKESEKEVRGLKRTNTWIREGGEGTISGKKGQLKVVVQNENARTTKNWKR